MSETNLPAVVEADEAEVPSVADELKKRARASKRVSWLLDECIRIPGTNLRFGLDPILGLIPYGGEAVATVIGAVVLGEAGKKGLPFKTLIRMGGNMILNAGVGAFPVIGDLFSVWFKSNSRNYEMLNQFLDSEEGQEVRGGWWPLLVVITIIGIVVIINVATWLFVIGFWYYLLRQGLSNTATG